MLTKNYKYSKNKVHEFIHAANINRQYFEDIRLKTFDFKSNLPEIKKQILEQFDFVKPWTKYFHPSYSIFLNSLVMVCLSIYLNIPILWIILSISLYIITHLFLNIHESYIEAAFQNIYHNIQEAESLYQISLLYISHLGLDCAIILQRICNQNSQFSNLLKYYHQSEEMLKYHRQDLDDLLRHLKKDYQKIVAENIEEKLDLLRKFNQELNKNIKLLKTSSDDAGCSYLTESLIKKSMFFIQKHQDIGNFQELPSCYKA